MKMLTKTILAATALMSAGAVSAQTTTFTGPRAEVRAGFDSLELNVPVGSRAAQGVSYGAALGYDHEIAPRIIAGVDVGIDDSTTDSTFGRTRADARRDIEIGARLGYRVSDNVLLYGRGAYSNARIGLHNGDTDLGSTIKEGWRVGGGAEYALTNRVYTKAEYRYTNYEGRDGERHQVLAGVGLRF